ncbi:MAG: PEP-CTERM sorting domain-containing protein [Sphingomonadaceae bacterium]
MTTFASKLAHCAAITFALVTGSASATEALNGQYELNSSATQIGANTYTFDFSVTNVNQGVGGQTGFDGFTIFVPDSATFVGATSPVPFTGAEHAPGFWSAGSTTGLNLMGDGSQNLNAPTGFHTFTWWGNYPESVYQIDSTAKFSITLSNVSAGTNTVGMSSYFGFTNPGQASALNQYGYYTTFTADAASPMAAVPEPETYAMLFAGLGLLGAVARRRKA